MKKSKRNELVYGLFSLFTEFKQYVKNRAPIGIDKDFNFDNFIDWVALQELENARMKEMSDEITGYYIDIPEGAQGISVNGAEQVPISEYTDGIVVAETPTHYGTIEWVEAPSSVEVDGNPVDVQPLIGGLHPTQRPK